MYESSYKKVFDQKMEWDAMWWMQLQWLIIKMLKFQEIVPIQSEIFGMSRPQRLTLRFTVS